MACQAWTFRRSPRTSPGWSLAAALSASQSMARATASSLPTSSPKGPVRSCEWRSETTLWSSTVSRCLPASRTGSSWNSSCPRAGQWCSASHATERTLPPPTPSLPAASLHLQSSKSPRSPNHTPWAAFPWMRLTPTRTSPTCSRALASRCTWMHSRRWEQRRWRTSPTCAGLISWTSTLTLPPRTRRSSSSLALWPSSPRRVSRIV
mmetsp:Transcript_19968/g.58327  ORF Transcript_19968/g.58327 Transcript_19968/m.58327 type:complete len:207 (+) Transcript_19968:1128-1748(+)